MTGSFGLKNDPQRSCDRQAKTSSDATGLEIIKNDGVDAFINRRLNHGGFSEIDFVLEPDGELYRGLTNDQAMSGLGVKRSVVHGNAGEQFLQHLLRHDDITHELGQQSQSARENRI